MLGFEIIIMRQQNKSMSPASFGIDCKTRLVSWFTGLNGLDWIEDLVKKNKALSLGGNGYPFEFTAKLKHIKSFVSKELDEAWSSTICNSDEWLLIEVWDQS
jgi:hypothetical protein